METESTIGCILGLDVGEKRTGVAISDPLRIVAKPLTIIQHTSKQADMEAICQLADEHQAVLIVCGYPLSLDDTEGHQGAKISKFVEELRQIARVPVELWDESYSTLEAEAIVKKGRASNHKRYVDAIAAAVILQSYMDARSNNIDYPSGW